VYFCGWRTRRLLDQIKVEEDWPKLIVRDLPGSAPVPRAPRRDPKRDPEPWELELLGLISEQGAIPLDQLARFRDCTMAEAKRIAKTLAQVAFANCESLLADQPDWVWLGRAGARLAPTPLGPWIMRVGGLEQVRALNELRLRFEPRSPESKWVGRRILLHRQGGREAGIPDAAVELADDSHALVLRKNSRNREVFARRLSAIRRNYDAVICICATPLLRRRMEASQERYLWPDLVIGDLCESK
jgi:hypothetical protein